MLSLDDLIIAQKMIMTTKIWYYSKRIYSSTYSIWTYRNGSPEMAIWILMRPRLWKHYWTTAQPHYEMILRIGNWRQRNRAKFFSTRERTTYQRMTVYDETSSGIIMTWKRQDILVNWKLTTR